MINLNLGKCDGVDIFTDGQSLPNGHIGIIGSSGNGKTVLAQRCIKQVPGQGGRVLALESHGSLSDAEIFEPYRDEILPLKQDFFVYKEGVPCGILDPITYPDGSQERFCDMVEGFVDIVSRALKFGTLQKSALRTAAVEALKETNDTAEVFHHMEQKLLGGGKAAMSVIEKMRPLFDRECFVNGSGIFEPGKINVIHVDRLAPEVQEVIPEIILSIVWRLACAEVFKDDPLWVFVDEFQDYKSGPDSALAKLISEGRKHSVNLILTSQLILQGSTNTVQQRISQCGVMLYGQPLPNRCLLTAKMINPADIEPWMIKLKSLKRGQFVATGNFLLDGIKVNTPVLIDAREQIE